MMGDMSTRAYAVAQPAAERSHRRATLAGAGVMSAAMLASGVLVYAFHVVAARSLGPDGYGRIAVLWATLFLAVIVLFRPLEQTTSRSIADRRARGIETVSVVRSVVSVALIVLAVLALAGALAWSLLADNLFVGDHRLTALLLAGIAFYGASYVVRGVLAGTGWYGGYAIFLLADAVVLLGLATLLLAVPSESLAATAIVAAGLAGAVVPLLVGRRRVPRSLSGAASGGFRVDAAVAFAGPASVIAVADQLLVNGGPLLVMLEGGGRASSAAGLVFAATMLVRVPVYLFQGFAASLLPNMTTLHVADERRLGRAAMELVTVFLGASLLIVGCVATVGPQAMTVLFGREFDAERTSLVLLAIGVGGYLAGSTCSQALLAANRGRSAAVAWALAGAVFVTVYHAVGGDALARVSTAFVSAALTALVLLTAALAVSVVRVRSRG